MKMVEFLQITVRFGEPLRRSVGCYRIQVQLPAPASVAQVLHHLSQRFPAFADAFAGKDLGHHYPYRLFLQHKIIAKVAYEHTQVEDGDLIHIVVPVAGGVSPRRLPPWNRIGIPAGGKVEAREGRL